MARFIKTKDDKVINIQYVQNLVINPEDDKELIIYKSNGDKIVETYDSSSDAESAYNEYKTKMTESGGGSANLQSKEVTITQNGTTTITPDSNYDGLSDVKINVNVPSNDYNVKMNTTFTSTDNTLMKNIVEIPNIDLTGITSANSLFNGCKSLITMPLLNVSHITNMQNMFSGCTSLDNVGLNNVLQMCTNATLITTNKTLKFIGLTSSQATTCTSLSNWASAQAAGWTTGY